ncbi:helix-turn-helix transcriptional regulator [Algoriphagus aestuariicola]|uniref:Helix-turn-helix transcriptional regulator n=1 Tax=Algoriphagus aestuariicola TaxID=1852016 RepID=A0ABS3BNI3_9BACT|nr:helix-turn-helix transcriptional regulator [Algoriphagus aestuariicola]MBN7800572.1 helix-turn-helix transcriptional regulator [Algoriphagus aestuariicola]
MSYTSHLLDSLLSEIDPLEQSKVDVKMEVAARIAAVMDSKGWSKRDLQKVMGASPAKVRRWLSGTENFTLDLLVHLEAVLGIKLLTKSF